MGKNYELGKDFAAYCIEELTEWDYPVELDGVTYTNPQEAASGFATQIFEADTRGAYSAEDVQSFVQGFLSKFD